MTCLERTDINGPGFGVADNLATGQEQGNKQPSDRWTHLSNEQHRQARLGSRRKQPFVPPSPSLGCDIWRRKQDHQLRNATSGPLVPCVLSTEGGMHRAPDIAPGESRDKTGLGGGLTSGTPPSDGSYLLHADREQAIRTLAFSPLLFRSFIYQALPRR